MYFLPSMERDEKGKKGRKRGKKKGKREGEERKAPKCI